MVVDSNHELSGNQWLWIPTMSCLTLQCFGNALLPAAPLCYGIGQVDERTVLADGVWYVVCELVFFFPFAPVEVFLLLSSFVFIPIFHNHIVVSFAAWYQALLSFVVVSSYDQVHLNYRKYWSIQLGELQEVLDEKLTMCQQRENFKEK